MPSTRRVWSEIRGLGNQARSLGQITEKPDRDHASMLADHYVEKALHGAERWPHGTEAAYKNLSCRCKDCRHAYYVAQYKRLKIREYRKKLVAEGTPEDAIEDMVAAFKASLATP